MEVIKKIVGGFFKEKIHPKDVLFLIPTCDKYNFKANKIRETWRGELEGLGFKYQFIKGDESLKVSTKVDDILYLPCEDNYESLLLKLALGYEYIYENYSFKYVYKIDDDCYPNLKLLLNKILPQISEHKYLAGMSHPKGGVLNDKWHYGKCSDAKFDQPYKYNIAPFSFAKGGYGYFLKKELLPYLISSIDTFRSELIDGVYSYEDMRVGEIMLENGVEVHQLKKYSVLNAKEYSDKSKNWMLVFDIIIEEDFEKIQLNLNK